MLKVKWGMCAIGVMGLSTVSVSQSAPPMSDDFNDGELRSDWQIITQDATTWYEESGGKLNVGGSAGATGELVLRQDSELGPVGSIQIDYDWSSCDDHKARVGIGLFDDYSNDSNGFFIKGVVHDYNGRDHTIDCNSFVNGDAGDYHYAENAPRTGSLLIERDHDHFRLCYMQGGGWQCLFEGDFDFAGVPLSPHLFTSNSNWNPNWEVALDNFNVVPEPTTFTLLACMAAGAATRRRRHS